ncbi:MAG: RNA 2',3'-cyclic phosphodiesterase [Acidobacteria bacterium]|nr:RNA 2',3'-cyclic phosphodiesterase [Acidobacteriota bacterium]MCI0566768.1 RNA 2',3'-cyclic phosphodiesterase [Acidobacteriota bacterium]
MRVFLAVDIPDRIQIGISKLQELLSDRGVRDIRWARPSGIHLTLRFCGEIPAETLRLVSEALAPPAPTLPFRVAIGSLGTFPPRGLPHVLVLSLVDREELKNLAAWVGARCEAAGIPRESRRFHPHLTLGRFRAGARPIALQLLEISTDLAGEEFEVDRFKIFQSHLGPDGARYQALAEFPLLAGSGS